MIKCIPTYYWYERIISYRRMLLRKILHKNPSNFFTIGNAGDLFAEDLIKYIYRIPAKYDPEAKKRLLTIGSIIQYTKPGDIICGIGLRSPSDIPESKPDPLTIYGLRGPLTYGYLEKAGFNLSQVKFLLDPGLLARYIFPEDNFNHLKNKKAIFIPHYRERYSIQKDIPKWLKFVDVDCYTKKLIKQIVEAEIVYTSSLHGIIFSHAYNKPVVFVLPRTKEPLFKYKDYFASINHAFPVPIKDISMANFTKDNFSCINFNYSQEDFYFPDITSLSNQ